MIVSSSLCFSHLQHVEERLATLPRERRPPAPPTSKDRPGPFVPFLPFSNIPRLSLFSARCRKGRYSGNAQLPLPRNARTGSFWPAPWLASLCSNGTHIAKYIASCFQGRLCHLDGPSLWRFRLAAHPPKTQKAHKALTKPTSLTFASPTLLCPIALLPYYPTRARAMVA